MKVTIPVVDIKHQDRLQALRQQMLLTSKKVPVRIYHTSYPNQVTATPTASKAQTSDAFQFSQSCNQTQGFSPKNFSQVSKLRNSNAYEVPKTEQISLLKKISNNFSKLNLQKLITIKNLRLFRNLGIFGLLGATTVMASFYFFNGDFIQKKGAVAGQISYVGSDVKNFEGYKNWILDNNSKKYSSPSEDLDKDELTNYEEFILQTNPTSSYSCDPKINDMDNLLNLVNPKTCKPIDFKNTQEADTINQVISLPDIQKKITESLASSQTKTETIKNSDTANLLSLFKANSYGEIAKLNSQELEDLSSKTVNEAQLKKTYLQQIKKINSYIENNRSYEVYDRDQKTPVDGAVYLGVSLEYNAPLKYVLAIARTESRFGTDAYTNTGNLTRPGQYKNIYSMGLTDSGSNIGFDTWEDGVKSFGKWYKKFQDRGVSDCSKWRIYNPNGDYCAKIEGLANEIDLYLKS